MWNDGINLLRTRRSSLAARESVVSLSLSKGGVSWRASDPGVRCRNLGVVLSDVEARLPQLRVERVGDEEDGAYGVVDGMEGYGDPEISGRGVGDGGDEAEGG